MPPAPSTVPHATARVTMVLRVLSMRFDSCRDRPAGELHAPSATRVWPDRELLRFDFEVGTAARADLDVDGRLVVPTRANDRNAVRDTTIVGLFAESDLDLLRL